jgi:hypothetical protein
MLRGFIINVLACAICLVAVGTGLVLMSGFETLGDSEVRQCADWPQESLLSFDRTLPTLLMFAHPRCPCTRASLAELKTVLARFSGKVSAQIFFLSPSRKPGAWTLTESWREATGIPGLTVRYDTDGSLAELFAAANSGEVLLYNPQGKLLFRGGITGGRGETGMNSGEAALVSAIAGATTTPAQSPVYGCTLGLRCETAQLGNAAGAEFGH